MRGENSEPRPPLPTNKAPMKPCEILPYLSGQRGFDWCAVHDQPSRVCDQQRKALSK